MNNIDISISHLEKLKLRRDENNKRRDAMPKPPTLHERIDTWFNTLSVEDQSRAWKMHEFKELFEESSQKIGAVLFELGWSRRRSWNDAKPTSRSWLKK